MTTSLSLQLVLVLSFVGLVILAGRADLRTWLIPNRYSLAIAALFPVYALAGGADPLRGLVAGGLVFGAGVVLFARGWMGGGDVKFLAAVGLWAGTDQLLPLLVVVSLAGGVMSLVEWFGGGGPRRLVGRFVPVLDVPVRSGVEAAAVPYGIAILVGGLYVAANSILPLFPSLEALR